MAESVYKVIELVGTSTESWEKAASAAVERAAETLRDLRVAEVVEQDLSIKDGKVRILSGETQHILQVRSCRLIAIANLTRPPKAVRSSTIGGNYRIAARQGQKTGAGISARVGARPRTSVRRIEHRDQGHGEPGQCDGVRTDPKAPAYRDGAVHRAIAHRALGWASVMG